MRYLLAFVAINIILISFESNAQEADVDYEEVQDIKHSLSIVPQYIYRGGLRLDYERRLKNKDNWITVAPQYFYDFEGEDYYYNSSNYADYTSLTGFGLNVYFKKSVYVIDSDNSTDVPKKFLYVQAGPGYQYYMLKNTEEVAIPYEEDGITYYRFTQMDVEKPIHRIGIHIHGGLQFALDKLLVDIFFGVINRYSLNGDGEIIKDGYQGWTDIDYSGMSLDGGIRIGFYF